MFKIFFVIVIVCIFLRNNVKRKGGWANPSTMLIFIYFVSTLISIPYILMNVASESTGEPLVYEMKYWGGALVFIGFLLLFLYPFYYFKENSVKSLVLPNIKIINMISTVLIILSIFSIAYFLPRAVMVFMMGNLGDLRVNMQDTREIIGASGLTNTIATVSASFYPFVMMMFFIYYIIGGHKKRCALLLFSSTSIIINVLCFVGRDGVVFWIFAFLFMYLVFYDYLSRKQLKALRKTFVWVAILAMVPFIAISIGRFGDEGNNRGTFNSIVGYMGQSLPNYCLFYEIHDRHVTPMGSFPLYWEIIGESEPEHESWIDGGTVSWVFGSFIKEFNCNFGMLGTLVVGVVLLLIFIGIFGKRKTKLYFYHFFIYIVFFQIYSQGVFYFRQYTRGGNLFIILCFVFFFFFKLVQMSNSNLILHKCDELQEGSKNCQNGTNDVTENTDLN